MKLSKEAIDSWDKRLRAEKVEKMVRQDIHYLFGKTMSADAFKHLYPQKLQYYISPLNSKE